MADETETIESQETSSEAQDDNLTDRVDTLEGKIDTILSRISGRGSRTRRTQADDADEVGSQVKQEVAKLKAQEDREKAEDEHGRRLADIEATVKKLTEKAPVEYRKITQMFWHE